MLLVIAVPQSSETILGTWVSHQEAAYSTASGHLSSPNNFCSLRHCVRACWMRAPGPAPCCGSLETPITQLGLKRVFMVRVIVRIFHCQRSEHHPMVPPGTPIKVLT